MKMIIDSPGEQVDLELVALAVNLALNNKCAVQMIEFNKKKGLKFLIKRAFKLKDPLVMKLVRNISQHDEVKKYFCVILFTFKLTVPKLNIIINKNNVVLKGICWAIGRNCAQRAK